MYAMQAIGMRRLVHYTQASQSDSCMAANMAQVMMAVLVALSSAGGAALVDENPDLVANIATKIKTNMDMTDEERLEQKTDRLQEAYDRTGVALELISVCLSDSDCDVNETRLIEVEARLTEKQGILEDALLDPANFTKPEREQQDERPAFNLTQLIAKRVAKAEAILEMVEACEESEDCDVDEATLEAIEAKAERTLDRAERCSEDLERCESFLKEKHQKRKKAKQIMRDATLILEEMEAQTSDEA